MIHVIKKDIDSYLSDIDVRCNNWDLSSNLVADMDNDISLNSFHTYLSMMKQMADVLEKYKMLLMNDKNRIQAATDDLIECDQKLGREIELEHIK